MYPNNSCDGKCSATVGPKLSGLPGDADYQGPDYRGTTVFLGAFTKFRKVTIGFVMSARPSACNYSAPTGRIFRKFDIYVFFRKSVEKIQASLKPDTNNGYFT